MFRNILDRQKGLTLIELLVAMALGVVLSGGMVKLFIESRGSYMQDDERARLQENARAALRTLSRDLSMAGFFGRYVNAKSNISTALVITGANDCNATWALDIDPHLEYDNNIDGVTSPYSCITAGHMVADSDVISLKRTLDTPSLFNGDTSSGFSGTFSDSDHTNRVYLRATNLGDTLTQIKGSSVTGADTTSGSLVDAWEYLARIYFVRNFSVAGDGIPSLCRVSLQADTTMEDSSACSVIAEGIENLQIEWGIDNDADQRPDRYTSTPTAAQLSNAVSAKIYVLARSVNTVPGYTNDVSYQLGTTAVAAANDGFYRKVFGTTVLLRNPFNL